MHFAFTKRSKLTKKATEGKYWDNETLLWQPFGRRYSDNCKESVEQLHR